MFFKILSIKGQIDEIKEAAHDPRGAAKNMAVGAIITSLLPTIITSILAFVLLFILGYTDVLGGPYGFFRFVFVFLLVSLSIMAYSGYRLYKSIRKVGKKMADSVNQNSPESTTSGPIIDAEIEE